MNAPHRPLRLAAVGCGGRARTYMALAATDPVRYRNVAAADPIPARRAAIREASGNPDLRLFEDDAALFAEPRLADVLIIGTQDADHKAPCLRAMEQGYDILLEKPIATTLSDVIELADAARRLRRRVLVCHVLRYTPLYQTVKTIVESGELGALVSINATEGVGAWHQAHSYVRGHWAVTEGATPMILAKSCHDLDILSWLVDRPCRSVASHGDIAHFKAEHRPEGAPDRCTDGCPLGLDCRYNALHYLGPQRRWLAYVMDGGETATEAEATAWLGHSRWGRCVYACDNTAIDHQTVALRFDGGVTATFTMTAFDDGRSLELFGTEARLYAGERVRRLHGRDIVVIGHGSSEIHGIDLGPAASAVDGHAGGDAGLMRALHEEMTRENPAAMRSSIQTSVESHRIGFAAEAARLSGRVIDLADFRG